MRCWDNPHGIMEPDPASTRDTVGIAETLDTENDLEEPSVVAKLSYFAHTSTWLCAAVVVVVLLAFACSDDAAPGECIDAAEEAGVPDAVIDWMKQPSDELGSIERIAIREALEKFGLGNVCSEVSDGLDLTIDMLPDLSSPEAAKSTPAEEPTARSEPTSQPTSTPTAPSTPLPPNTPVPTDTATPSPKVETPRRAERRIRDYVIPGRYDDYPEVIGLEHKGVPGDPDSRFVVVLDELVQVEDRRLVILVVLGPDSSESILELRTLTSSSRPTSRLEFGPVEERLSRLYAMEVGSNVLDGDGNPLSFDSDELRRHPNALFVGSDYTPNIQDPSLARCAAVMEFNDVSPILIRSLSSVDTATLGDTERFEWYTTLINELGSTPFNQDRVELDFDQGDFLQVMRHPCAVLWSEVVTTENADKRNARGECRPHDPDVTDLLEASYLDLNATDRLVLKRELGGWSAVDCLVYYPQLYTGLWIPLPLED